MNSGPIPLWIIILAAGGWISWAYAMWWIRKIGKLAASTENKAKGGQE